jgi:hypothetical protein
MNKVVKAGSLHLVWVLVCFFCACNKETTEKCNKIIYREFANKSFRYLQDARLDLDENGSEDFVFNTLPVMRDGLATKEFGVVSLRSNAVWYHQDQQVITPLHDGDKISSQPAGTHQWEQIERYLFDVRYPLGQDSSWQGAWKNANLAYLGVKFTAGAKNYVGWIALSADTLQGRMIIHNAAFTTDSVIFAGH